MNAHTVTFLLIDIAVVIAVARVFGKLAQKVNQPAVVGEIVAGITLGPSLLGALPGDLDTRLFPTDVRPLLLALAQIGLVLFMFIVGLELDLGLTKGRERLAASISMASVVLPFALGFGLAWVLHPKHSEVAGKEVSLLALALFLGTAMSITAFPVLARILTARGMQRTVPGVISLASAAVDDVIAWTLLALVIAVIEGGSPAAVARTVGLTAAFAFVIFAIVRPLLRRLLRWRNRSGHLTSDILAVLLVGLFACAAITDMIGIHSIFGAFMFGAAMPRAGAHEFTKEILQRLEQVSVLLLLPMFFVVTGLAVDLGGISGGGLWQLLLILLVAMGGKFIGAYTGARMNRLPNRQSVAVAVLLNTRGLTELVILQVGRELGVLDDELFAMLVVMALVTTVITEPLLRWVYPNQMVRNEIAATERKALVGTEANRVLILIDDLSGSPGDVLIRYASVVPLTRSANVVLVGLVSQTPESEQVELGAAALPDLATMANSVETLNGVALLLPATRSVSVLCRFSTDGSDDVIQMAANVRASVVVVDSRWMRVNERVRAVASSVPLVIARTPDVGGSPVSAADAEPVTCIVDDSRGGQTALVLAATLAAVNGRMLIVESRGSVRRLESAVALVRRHGLAVAVVEQHEDWRRPVTVGVYGGTDGAVMDLAVCDETNTSDAGISARLEDALASPAPAAAERARHGHR